ncbi:MAG: insulinase family protein, partial [Xanthobacteraceae bacterium]
RPVPLEEIVAKIEAVTVDSVRLAGTAMLSRGQPVVTVLGPGTRLESAAAIAESLTRRLM